MFASVGYHVTEKYQTRVAPPPAIPRPIGQVITIGGYKSRKEIGDEVQIYDELSQSIINVGVVQQVIKDFDITTRLVVQIVA